MSELIKVKTSELEGAALDWAVVEALGGVRDGHRIDLPSGYWCVGLYSPSREWQQGGPLIDKYQLTLSSPKSSVHRNGGPSHGWGESGVWSACTWEKGVNGKRATGYHESSALAAAMRTIVKFELGDTVEVPKELVT